MQLVSILHPMNQEFYLVERVQPCVDRPKGINRIVSLNLNVFNRCRDRMPRAQSSRSHSLTCIHFYLYVVIPSMPCVRMDYENTFKTMLARYHRRVTATRMF